MPRYRLDDLGWYQFEKLLQALLKAELGIAVEAWGGRGDWGRDAYSEDALCFPARSKAQAGPFIFQAKFVSGANAAGARPLAPLRKAIVAEARAIQTRIKKKTWRQPRHYAMLTNVPMTAVRRKSLGDLLAGVMRGTRIHFLGGDDVCDLIDNNPNLTRSFPEILSLRNLDQLLEAIVNKEVVERSKSAIQEAWELMPVFVATRAYFRSLNILKNHSFVVLDGPPEMGKTAIARVISFVQFAAEWEPVDCRRPSDFFSSFRIHDPQVFIADDAFGRTEYDPTLGRAWERDLPHILRRLDKKHWLIWTTRKHILARALQSFDLTGPAQTFPDPAEVVVSASDLLVEEKARILYRHARHARLDSPLKQIVSSQAEAIVDDPHFTPERIRRFVVEALPNANAGSPDRRSHAANIERLVKDAIQNPTDRMRKSFLALSMGHRWALIALLDCDDPADIGDLGATYDSLYQETSEEAFIDLVEDLDGSFLSLMQNLFTSSGRTVSWIHPSYRDIVIDELARDLASQAQFLSRASVIGVNLALSEAGGEEGTRVRPLLGSLSNWERLHSRCRALAEVAGESSVRDLLAVLNMASSSTRAKERANPILLSVYEGFLHRVLTDRIALDVATLEVLWQAAWILGASDRFPRLRKAWISSARELLSDGSLCHLTVRDLEKYHGMCDLIRKRDPVLWASPSFSRRHERVIAVVLAALEDESEYQEDCEESYEYQDLSERFEGLAEYMQSSSADWPAKKSRVQELCERLGYMSGFYNERMSEKEAEEEKRQRIAHEVGGKGSGDSGGSSLEMLASRIGRRRLGEPEGGFDVGALFEDL